MRGVFRAAAPEEASYTLSMTTTLAEWRLIRKQLDDSLSGSPPDVLGRQVRDLIAIAEAALARESWTTGYATGPVEN